MVGRGLHLDSVQYLKVWGLGLGSLSFLLFWLSLLHFAPWHPTFCPALSRKQKESYFQKKRNLGCAPCSPQRYCRARAGHDFKRWDSVRHFIVQRLAVLISGELAHCGNMKKLREQAFWGSSIPRQIMPDIFTPTHPQQITPFRRGVYQHSTACLKRQPPSPGHPTKARDKQKILNLKQTRKPKDPK